MKKMIKFIISPWIILSILLISFLFFELTPIDIYIQDYFYNFNSKQWILDRNAVIPKLIFYDGIKIIFIVFVIAVLITVVFSRRITIIKHYQKGLMIVLLSCVLVPLFIGLLKATTNVPCPKDIERYGGNYPNITVLSKYPATFVQTKNIKCYPAGHASGGFALMSLFFLFFSCRNRLIALISAISIGWTIGNYKMLIGDHYFSHTYMTMMISWLIIVMISYGVNRFSFNIDNDKA